MRVEVTQEDIDRGTRQSPWWCPIALAVRRKMEKRRGLVAVTVTGSCTARLSDGGVMEYDLPNNAMDFLIRYDNGETVSPITFEMRRAKERE